MATKRVAYAAEGRVLENGGRLTDPAAATAIARITDRAAKDQAFAHDWLVKHGFLTPTGRTPKRFGG